MYDVEVERVGANQPNNGESRCAYLKYSTTPAMIARPTTTQRMIFRDETVDSVSVISVSDRNWRVGRMCGPFSGVGGRPSSCTASRNFPS